MKRLLLIIPILFIGCADCPPPCTQITNTQIVREQLMREIETEDAKAYRVGLFDIGQVQEQSNQTKAIQSKLNDHPRAQEFSNLIANGETSSDTYKKLKSIFVARAVTLTTQSTELIRKTVISDFRGYQLIMDKTGAIWYCANPAIFKEMAEAKLVKFQTEDITNKIIEKLQ